MDFHNYRCTNQEICDWSSTVTNENTVQKPNVLFQNLSFFIWIIAPRSTLQSLPTKMSAHNHPFCKKVFFLYRIIFVPSIFFYSVYHFLYHFSSFRKKNPDQTLSIFWIFVSQNLFIIKHLNKLTCQPLCSVKLFIIITMLVSNNR